MPADSTVRGWQEAKERCEAGEGTPVDWMVYADEPAGEDGVGFRRRLSGLVAWLCGKSDGDTSQRKAVCSLCGKVEASSPSLPFFRAAREQCHICEYFEESHHRANKKAEHLQDGHAWTPYMPGHDSYWCGCRREDACARENHDRKPRKRKEAVE